MVTSPQVLTASRLAAAQLPTDLLRTQAVRHGAQLWGWRFEVCHTNLQEPHILLFRVTWKDKWEGAQLRWGWHTLLRLQETRTVQTVPDRTWELLPLSQWVSSSSQAPYNPRLLPQSLWSGEWEGELGDEKTAPHRATVPAETCPLCLLQPGMGQPLVSPSLGLKIVFIWMPKRWEENTAQEESTHRLCISIFKKYKDTPKGAGSAGYDEDSSLLGLGSADGRESSTATQGPKGKKEAQWDAEGCSSQALTPPP